MLLYVILWSVWQKKGGYEIFTLMSNSQSRNGKKFLSYSIIIIYTFTTMAAINILNLFEESILLWFAWWTASFLSDRYHISNEEQKRREWRNGRDGAGSGKRELGYGWGDSVSLSVLSRFSVSGRPSQNVIFWFLHMIELQINTENEAVLLLTTITIFTQ